jgi:hypothetical protein
MKFYHGTTGENAESIMNDGFICGRAYFSPRYEVAADYALANDPDGAVVIAVELEIDILRIDNESYDGDDLQTALDRGVSVYVDSDVDINDAYFDKIGYDCEN